MVFIIAGVSVLSVWRSGARGIAPATANNFDEGASYVRLNPAGKRVRVLLRE
jgi:hypothetical protein